MDFTASNEMNNPVPDVSDNFNIPDVSGDFNVPDFG